MGGSPEDRVPQGQRHSSLRGCIDGVSSGELPMGKIDKTYLPDSTLEPISNLEIFLSGKAQAFRQIRRERIWAVLLIWVAGLAEGRGTGCAESKAELTRK